MKKFVQKEIYLHALGFSTSQIAKKLQQKKNTIIVNLRNHGVLRQSLGRDIEEKVAQWFEKQGIKVERQRGDAPYDLFMMKKRYDVKSSHKGKSGYAFEIQHKQSRKKDLSLLDYFLLVFLDEERQPIYQISTNDISVTKVHITSLSKTKLPLQFIGFLEEIAR